MLRLKLCYTCFRFRSLSLFLSPSSLLLIPSISLLAPFVRWLSAHQALIYGPKNVGHVGHSNRSKQRQRQQQKATAKRPHRGSTWSHTNKQINTQVGVCGEWERDSNQLKCSMNILPLIASHCILCCCIRVLVVVVVVVFWHSRCCGALCNRQSHAHVHTHAQWDTHHMQAALAAAEPWQRQQQRRRVYLYCVCVYEQCTCVQCFCVCWFVGMCIYISILH